MGLNRHKTTKMGIKKRRASQMVSGSPGLKPISVDREYSLAGCSPALPASACSDEVKIIPTIEFKPKSFPQVLGFR
jgi:hypothetical protein